MRFVRALPFTSALIGLTLAVLVLTMVYMAFLWQPVTLDLP